MARFRLAFGLLSVLCLSVGSIASADERLRARLNDVNGVRSDVWIYNDIATAIAKARKVNKPLFVTFRCVPCKDCAAFDADVANGNERVRQFAKERFVSVRQVEMKGVDLSVFEFDFDLNWAAVFIHPDGTVYARYGTQSARGPDAYNSIDGLLHTMRRVLRLHAEYPANKAELEGKRPKRPRGQTALELPGMKNAEKLARQTTRSNCVHCHMIHDAMHFHAQQTGTFTRDLLWKYPLPENVGLEIDPDHGLRIERVLPDSPAAAAGLKAGDEVVRMNGQRMASIADMQWVMHHLPNGPTTLVVETARGSMHRLALERGWKETDISWRGSLWSVSPRLRVWTPILAYDRRKQLGIPDSNTALLVKWINRGAPGGRAAFESGLREGDVIVELDGRPLQNVDPARFNMLIKLNYEIGDRLPLTVLRRGRRIRVEVRLVE
ncbi:MAG: PDZ domain-containing protein [Planctomycetota bacterium]|nr:MAG: PDZ domain-containing protein [Planctomycetota bacterium]